MSEKKPASPKPKQTEVEKLRAEVHRLLDAANNERQRRNDLSEAVDGFMGQSAKMAVSAGKALIASGRAIGELRDAGEDILTCGDNRAGRYTTDVPAPSDEDDEDDDEE